MIERYPRTSIISLWLLIYFLAIYLPYAKDGWFYTNQIMYSFILASGLMYIRSKIKQYHTQIMAIILLTTLFGLVNLIISLEYMRNSLFLYYYYDEISSSINAAEVVTLFTMVTYGFSANWSRLFRHFPDISLPRMLSLLFIRRDKRLD